MVDFHWNPAEPFTLMSVADDSALDKGGGTLQLWRISDLVTRPEEEVLAELEPHRRDACHRTELHGTGPECRQAAVKLLQQALATSPADAACVLGFCARSLCSIRKLMRRFY